MAIIPAKAVDRRLMKEAATMTSTPQSLSDAVNGQLSPAQAHDRVKQILESINVYDEVEERRLLLFRMSKHLDFMEEQKHNPKAWGAINRTFKLVSDQMERSRLNVADISTKLSQDHARYFVEGYMQGFNALLNVMSERLALEEIVIEEDEIQEMAQVGVKNAQEYIEKVTARDEAA